MIARLDFTLSVVEYTDQPVILGATFYSPGPIQVGTPRPLRHVNASAYRLHQLKTLPSEDVLSVSHYVALGHPCVELKTKKSHPTSGQMLHICVLRRGKVGGYWVKLLNLVRNRWNFSTPPNLVLNSENRRR